MHIKDINKMKMHSNLTITRVSDLEKYKPETYGHITALKQYQCQW